MISGTGCCYHQCEGAFYVQISDFHPEIWLSQPPFSLILLYLSPRTPLLPPIQLSAQLIPGLSPTSWFTTVLPLVCVLLINAVKEGYDDYHRHK